MTGGNAFWFCMGVLASLLCTLAGMVFGPRRGEYLDTPTFPDDHDIEVKEANHDHH